MDKELLREIDSLNEMVAPAADRLADDVLICECFCVSAQDIRQVCNVFDLDLVQKELKLGHGCQSCIKDINSWVSKIF